MRKKHGYGRLCAALITALCFSFVSAHAEIGSTRIRWVEQTLYAMGYHSEESNAVLDDETRNALRSFQTANGLTPTGEPDEATLLLMEAGTGVTCHEYLVTLSREYAGRPLLQTGSSGDSVVRLQKRLKELGFFAGSCDGVFGEATEAAVRRFQQANGLTVTGVADSSVQLRLDGDGAFTWQDFVESGCATPGDSGVQVRRLQRELKELGYYNGAQSGVFGERLERAVSLFQSANGLAVTGAADGETVRALYSGRAAAYRDPATLNRGDVGDAVTALQTRLSALGYLDSGVTGSFGAATETAVRLFQMGNGFPPTGEADAALQSRAESDAAVPLDSVRTVFLEQLTGQPESIGPMLAAFAADLRGTSFSAPDNELIRGFAFVQYVCAACGVPVAAPEDLTAMLDESMEKSETPGPGEILAFRMEDAERAWMQLAISTGDGRAVYASTDSGYVLESPIRSMDGTDVYRWKMGTQSE